MTDAESQFLCKVFTNYQKGSLALSNSQEISQSNLVQNKQDVLILYPPATPSIGAMIEWRKMFAVAWSFSLPKEIFVDDRLNHSKVQHIEVHSNAGRFGWDAHVLRYEGLYASYQSKVDIRPFQDSLFRGNSNAKALPAMKLESAGLGGIYNFSEDQIDLGALFNQNGKVKNNNWGLVGSLQLRGTRFLNSDAIDPGYFDMRSGHVLSMSVGPGVVAQMVNQNWYMGAAGFFAPALSQTVIDQSQAIVGYANYLNIKGSAGFNNGNYAFGLNGNKSLLTVDLTKISLTESVSAMELFYSRRI